MLGNNKSTENYTYIVDSQLKGKHKLHLQHPGVHVYSSGHSYQGSVHVSSSGCLYWHLMNMFLTKHVF